ncbi:MAG: urea ABC transporter ATP-binding protein UrtD [Spirochaetaceae bacterium]|nr:urea ABC transporter ATP-binding protein UrtD [Spirochaetaceae bacterium]
MLYDILYVESVTVEFDGFRALEHVNLIVRKGELRFLIGPNGAGKTTLLDVICGKVKPVEGRVQFANEIDLLAHDEHSVARMGISRKFQAPSVFDSLTVQQNMALAAEVPRGFLAAAFHREGRAARRRIDEVLDMVGLADQRGGVAGTLAHGEKQWLELGMAIVQDPELLLVDEPVAGMTAGERERTGEILEAIARERSVVVVEHDMQFVSRFSSLVTVLHAGRVICEGDFATVKQDPTVIDVYLGREPGGADAPGGGNAA